MTLAWKTERLILKLFNFDQARNNLMDALEFVAPSELLAF